MLRWMGFEQYNHEPNIATIRFWVAFVGEANLTDAQRDQIPAKRKAGEAALQLMDEHLDRIAPISSATASASPTSPSTPIPMSPEEGGFRLGDYANVQAWLERIATTPGYVAMED